MSTADVIVGTIFAVLICGAAILWGDNGRLVRANEELTALLDEAVTQAAEAKLEAENAGVTKVEVKVHRPTGDAIIRLNEDNEKIYFQPQLCRPEIHL